MFSALTALGFSACNSAPKVKVYASYLTGRVNFTSAAPATQNAPVVIEHSDDAFVTVRNRIIVSNTPNLLSVPYRIDFEDATGDFVQLRAFQDTNSDGNWDAGEPEGRFDSSDTSDATPYTINRVVGFVCPPGYPNEMYDKKTGRPLDFCSDNWWNQQASYSHDDDDDDDDKEYISGVDIILDGSAAQ